MRSGIPTIRLQEPLPPNPLKGEALCASTKGKVPLGFAAANKGNNWGKSYEWSYFRIVSFFLLFTLITFSVARAQLPPPPGPDSIAIKLQLRQIRHEDSLKAHTYINRILTAGKDSPELVVNKEYVLRKDGRIRNSYKNIPSYVAYLFLFAFALLAIIVIIDRELLTQLFG